MQPAQLRQRIACILTIFNVLDPKTFQTPVAPGGAIHDPGAEEAAQRLPAVGAEPHGRVCLIDGAHRSASL